MAATDVKQKSTVRRKFRNFDLSDEIKMVGAARKGISAEVFYIFARLIKMPEKSLAELLYIHPRTINNYREQEKNLAPVESEHLLRLIALFAKGEELFGNADEFNYWLQKPFWSTKEKPIDWLTTPGGVGLVSDELDRLAHGYVA